MNSRLSLLLLLTLATAGCSSGTSTSTSTTAPARTPVALDRAATIEAPPKGGATLEALEGPADTVEFHIGSPLLLRLRLDGTMGCGAGTGQFFYFDNGGMQLGWGFEEAADSIVLRTSSSFCERFVLLSSEASNRLAEGVYSMRVSLFLSPTRSMESNSIVLRAVRSTTGADEESYTRFLQEQLVLRPEQLRDPETIDALFGEGVPVSAESEVYRAVILARAGDIAGADASLRSAAEIARTRKSPLTNAAAATRDALTLELRRELPGH